MKTLLLITCLFLGCSAGSAVPPLVVEASPGPPLPEPPSEEDGPTKEEPEEKEESSKVLDVDTEPYFDSPDGKQAMNAFRAGRYAEAAEEFEVLSREPLTADQKLPSLYMEAVCIHYSGDWKKSAALFSRLEKTYPLLRTYHLYFKGEALRRQGKFKEALACFNQIPSTDANGERASLSALYSLQALEQHTELLRAADRHRKAHGISRKVAYLMGDAGIAAKEYKKAAQVHREIRVRWPSHADSKEGTKLLNKLQGRFPKKKAKRLTSLSPSEEMERAMQLFKAHRSREAIAAFTKLATRHKKGSEERCTALHRIARSYDKLRKRKDAAPWHVKSLKECAKSGLLPDILYFAGKSAYQRGAHADALQYFDQLHATFPEVSYNDDAWIWEAQIHEEEKAPEKRKKALRQSVENMPEGDMWEQAAWLLIWDLWREKKYREVVTQVDATLSIRPRARYRYAEGRLRYWKARAQQMLDDVIGASSTFGETLSMYPLSYYGLLSYSRLCQIDEKNAHSVLANAIRQSEKTASALPSVDPKRLEDGRVQTALELIRIGLPDPAKRELDRADFGKSPEERWALAQILHAARLFEDSYALTRRDRGAYAQHYPVGPHKTLWETAYPNAYSSLVETHAATAKIPPEFALAIMRTESAFNPKAESWANAVGLMQLLISTAQDLAKSDEKPKPTRTRLHNPSRNIELGTRFLGQLFDAFGHLGLAAAGYNAGGGAVRKWLRQRGELPYDEFVESIPYREARRYTKSVLSSYSTYRFLYKKKMPRIQLVTRKSNP